MGRDPSQVVVRGEETHNAAGHHVADVGDDATSFIHLERGKTTLQGRLCEERQSRLLLVCAHMRQSPCVESLCSGR